MTELLKFPATKQEEIANAIYTHLNSSNKEVEEELGKRFARIESGDYEGYTIDEVKEKLIAKWQNR